MEMTKEELIQFISENRAVKADEPFNKATHNNRVVFDAIRHVETGKIFALVYMQNEHLYVDLKQKLEDVEELVEFSPNITIGRHFDKKHWITVDVTLLGSEIELKKLVTMSFQLTGN